jgi:hypothetical protein
MPVNSFNVGKDVQLDIVDPVQGVVSFTLITGFTAKQKVKEVSVNGLDGLLRPLILPNGWEGSFNIERSDSLVDDYFAAVEAAYYNGQSVPSATITETISEASGAVSQYRYTGVMLKFEDAGEWKGDNSVKLRVGFAAGRRLKVQ